VAERQAGREFDAWIAEHVMGWTLMRIQMIEQRDCDGFRKMVPCHVGCPPSCVSGSMMHAPRYSTDTGKAFEVVAKMESIGCVYQMNSPGLFSDGDQWSRFKTYSCVFQKGATETAALFELFGQGLADTMELAICRAAAAVIEDRNEKAGFGTDAEG